MNLDALIREAIQGSTSEKPQDLVGILYHIDSRMKLCPTHEELVGALQRLSESGAIAEVARHKFYETKGVTGSAFSGLTLEEHRSADAQYRKWFWKTYGAKP